MRRAARRFGRWGIVLSVICGISIILVITARAAGAPPFQPSNSLQTAAQKQAQLHRSTRKKGIREIAACAEDRITRDFLPCHIMSERPNDIRHQHGA